MARHHPRNILLFRKNRYMQTEIEDNTDKSEQNPDNPSFITQDIFEQKLSEIQEMINRASNGVAKKLEKRIESLTQPKEETSQSLTIETLRSEYEQKLKDIQESSFKELETFKQQLAEKERSEFLYKVDSTIASAFAKQRFDDVSSAMMVFSALHPKDKFKQGDGGVIIYEDGDKPKSLDNLIESWVSSPVGKKFIVADPIPNGTGQKEQKPKAIKNDDSSSQPGNLTAHLLKTKKLEL